MDQDYYPSEKYTMKEIEDLKVPYAFQDSCVDQICDYRSCVN